MTELKITDLHYSYGRHSVLKGVSLAVEAGEMVYLLGANGAGKTTLFNLMLRIAVPKRGTIRIEDTDICDLTPRQIARKIAFIPQTMDITFNYKVLDVVLMGRSAHLSIFKQPTNPERLLAYQILDELGILDLSEKGFKQISGGERQLALIARALIQQAKIIIMDEPLANLDYGNSLRLQSQLKKLSDKGMLIIQSCHNPQHALLFSSKVLILRNGVIDRCGVPNQVLTSATIKEIYDIEVEVKEGILIPSLEGSVVSLV